MKMREFASTRANNRSFLSFLFSFTLKTHDPNGFQEVVAFANRKALPVACAIVDSSSSPAPVLTIVGVVSFSCSSSPLAESPSSSPSVEDFVVRREFPNGDGVEANGFVVFAPPNRSCEDHEEVDEVVAAEDEPPNVGVNEEKGELDEEEEEEEEEEVVDEKAEGREEIAEEADDDPDWNDGVENGEDEDVVAKVEDVVEVEEEDPAWLSFLVYLLGLVAMSFRCSR